MQVLAFASVANGAGKTTLAAHVAAHAHRGGVAPVAMIDADPRGALSKWRELRSQPGPAVIDVDGADIGEVIAGLRGENAELVVIDTPAEIDAGIERVIALADLVAIPVRPSQYDLKAAGATVEVVERLGRPHVFVINGGSPQTDITAEAVAALAQHGTVATTIVPSSSEFGLTMAYGRTVAEARTQDPPSSEIERLWDYLSTRLTGGAPVGGGEEGTCAKDSRRFPRLDVDQPAHLVAKGREVPCTVNDISAGGALIFGDDLPAVGDAVAIDIFNVGRLNAEVVHGSTNRIGLKFVIGARQQWTLVRHLSDMIEAGRTAFEVAP